MILESPWTDNLIPGVVVPIPTFPLSKMLNNESPLPTAVLVPVRYIILALFAALLKVSACTMLDALIDPTTSKEYDGLRVPIPTRPPEVTLKFAALYKRSPPVRVIPVEELRLVRESPPASVLVAVEVILSVPDETMFPPVTERPFDDDRPAVAIPPANVDVPVCVISRRPADLKEPPVNVRPREE